MLHRREFIKRATVAATLFGIPLARAEQLFAQQASPVPPQDLFASDPQRYWAELRRQWLLGADRINFRVKSATSGKTGILRVFLVLDA